MLKGKLVLSFAIAGMALASAKSYTMNLYDAVLAGKTELKAGEYQVKLVDQKVVITKSGMRTENDVKVESTDRKYDSTIVLVSNTDGKSRIKEIHLGGTKTKLVFAEGSAVGRP